ncbi:pirin family protein [Paenibacillus pinistramenti]|uniref:pirin family protein n=1 Tax=Paenibacillus pinistramenti TaxID=1768003 RepID=UPI00110914C2|nr:pirin family protein [Paenibacillus pinistramenti]
MIKKQTAAERHTSHSGSIHGEYSFSFSEYEDAGNEHFGCMLVHNDYTLMAQHYGKDWPNHDLEIITMVIEGKLRYTDSLGNAIDLPEGSVHVLTSGTGVTHSESNPSDKAQTRYLQFWFLPARKGAEPRQKSITVWEDQRRNQLFPAVSGRGEDPYSLPVTQDLTLYVSKLETDKELELPARSRRTYIFVTAGNLKVECGKEILELKQGDSARIHEPAPIRIIGTASEGQTDLLVVDMP